MKKFLMMIAATIAMPMAVQAQSAMPLTPTQQMEPAQVPAPMAHRKAHPKKKHALKKNKAKAKHHVKHNKRAKYAKKQAPAM